MSRAFDNALKQLNENGAIGGDDWKLGWDKLQKFVTDNLSDWGVNPEGISDGALADCMATAFRKQLDAYNCEVMSGKRFPNYYNQLFAPPFTDEDEHWYDMIQTPDPDSEEQ